MLLDFHPLILAKCLTLLALANGGPVFAKRILGDTWSWPVDGGVILQDRQPLFGRSKTVRGILIALTLTMIAGWLMGLGLATGALIGGGAMAGDLLSSFTKRRLGMPPSNKAPGLDQVPESLMPLILVAADLDLSILDILIGVGLFWVGELVLSRWLYALKIRDRPY